jgi:peptide-methionine (S)-S-oxide reductase
LARRVYADPIVTEVLPLAHYWPAEAYHQNYFARNPGQGYCQHVVRPKVEKFHRTFAQRVRS